MAAEIPKNMKFYKYVVEAFDILLPGKDPYKVQNGQINSIMIERDFDSDFFPALRLNLMLDVEMYQAIVANKLEARFRMRLQKYIYDSEENLQIKRDVFNAVFCVFMDEHTPFLDKSTFDLTKEQLDIEKSPENVGGEEQIFDLFKEKDINNAHTVVNDVISSASMTDAVAFLFTKAGISSHVLMSPLENTQTYREIIIPPLTFLGAINYLQSQYGLYKYGPLLFFDIDRTYLIAQHTKGTTAWATQEYKRTVFNIRKSVSSDSLNPGSIDDAKEKTYYINVIPTDIQMVSPSVTNDITQGNRLVVVTPSTGAVKQTKAAGLQVGNGNAKVMVDNFGSKYDTLTESYRRDESGMLVQVNVGDVDVDALTPNKEFMFTYEDPSIAKQYAGPHRLAKSITTFVKQGEEFMVSAQLLFKKII